ncbi:hypothetical protein O181_034036 [Austropuccinia psidii MF-1]|uniref:Uncharacterized protein n=1 Tax=Austropuccinia psidii MF-1 TaxID=1389203 RepID=A0A9Q3H7M5_9BASI|nr:hypothetical protein [Austropuccinia psidii MF-1]
MSSYLHIKIFLGQEKTIEPLGIWSLLSCKDKVKKIKSWLKNKSLLTVDQLKGLEMIPALEKERQGVSTSSRTPQGPQRKQKGPRTNKGKGKHKANQNRPYPQEYRIPKSEP